MIQLRLRLQPAWPCCLHLRFCVDDLARRAAAQLPLGVPRLLYQVVLARGRCFGCIAGCCQIVALDGGDELACRDGIALVDRQFLIRPGNPRTDDHLIGIDRADELQVLRTISR